MSFAKRLARLASLLASSSMIFVACNFSATADQPNVSDASAGSKARDGAGVTFPPAADAGPCQPADVSTFQAPPYRSAKRAAPNSCTADQIDRFYVDCLASGHTAASCAPFGDGG